MKKGIYVLITILALPLFSQAQNTFAPLGAEWWFQYSFHDYGSELNPYFEGNFHTRSISDTTIFGIDCHKITTVQQERNSYYPDSLFTTQQKTFYFYDNTDTAFVYNDNFGRFTPLYVFNAVEGDTICLPIPPSGNPDLRPNPISGDTSFCFAVDSVRIVLYDTAHLKTYYTHALYQDVGTMESAFPAYNWGQGYVQPGAALVGKYTERIIGEFIPTKVFMNCADCWTGTEPPYGNILCYADNIYSIKLTDLPCDSIPDPPTLGIDNLSGADAAVVVYPNPARDVLILKTGRSLATKTRIQFTDLTGRTVQPVPISQSNKQISCDVSSIPSGIYFLNIHFEEGDFYCKIMVQH